MISDITKEFIDINIKSPSNACIKKKKFVNRNFG